MKIGYLGLGNMGAPMACNLAKAGCDVMAYDIDEEKIGPVAEAGAKRGSSAEEVAARSEILFTSLPEPRHVEAAMPPLFEAMPSGSVWVDLTTNSRELLKQLAEQAEGRGIATVEAPLTGAVDGARRGRLTFFVGGEGEPVERVMPLFRIMGKPILCGPIGCGNVVKLASNQIWFINAAAMSEALIMGKKAGVDLRVLWEGMQSSVGDTFVLRHDAPSVFAGHYDPSFTLGLCLKDLRLIRELAEETGTKIDVTRQAEEKFMRATERYGKDEPELLVSKLDEEDSGADLRLDGDWPKHWEAE